MTVMATAIEVQGVESAVDLGHNEIRRLKSGRNKNVHVPTESKVTGSRFD